MSKHTPGPWVCMPTTAKHSTKQSVRLDVLSEGVEFSPSFVAGDILPEDARLIAAAPDLLDALKALSAQFDAYANRDLTGEGVWRTRIGLSADREKARAAIAKAEGTL